MDYAPQDTSTLTNHCRHVDFHAHGMRCGPTFLSFLLSLTGYLAASCCNRAFISLNSKASAASLCDSLPASSELRTSGPWSKESGRGRPLWRTCLMMPFNQSECLSPHNNTTLQPMRMDQLYFGGASKSTLLTTNSSGR